jgi:hypothetical protein
MPTGREATVKAAQRPCEKGLCVAAVSMGYGHLRAAHALAEHLDCAVAEVDAAPWAGPAERLLWSVARNAYEGLSRLSQRPAAGHLGRRLLSRLTAIDGDLPSSPRGRNAVRLLRGLIRVGLGARLAGHLDRHRRPLLTTFYAPALGVDRWGCTPVACLITDSDIHPIWAPGDPSASRILYLTPNAGVRARLLSYGVPEERIEVTGFPLPPALVGCRDRDALKRNLADRLIRLDPAGRFLTNHRNEVEQELGPLSAAARRAPLIVFAVGGAGAQADRAATVLDDLGHPLRQEMVRLALVAGTRRRVRDRFREMVRRRGLDTAGVTVLHASDFASYYRRFNALLAEADLLWTKPGELVFYGALGLPLVLADAVGDHEECNRRWADDCGATVQIGARGTAWSSISRGLEDGRLVTAAWKAYRSMPAEGLCKIAEVLEERAFTSR